MGHDKLHRAAVTLLLALDVVWRNLIQAVLWTPANAHLKFTSSGSKWLYFQFQSGLVHSLVTVITAVGVLFHVALALVANWLGTRRYFIQELGYGFAVWNFAVVIGSLLVKYKFPAKAFKLQYVFVFLSAAGSFNVLVGFLESQSRQFVLTQISAVFFYIYMALTLLFQWSTLLSIFIILLFGGKLLALEFFRANTPYEAAAIFLMTLGILVFCVMVHIMINFQKRQAFQKIEEAVEMRLGIEKENIQLESLLMSIFPKDVAHMVVQDLQTKPLMERRCRFRSLYINRFDNVSILYADINGFTNLSSQVTAQQLVGTLNELFSRFDYLAEVNGCLRIKLLGDCYYCVAGLYDSTTDHALHSVEMGLQMIEVVRCVSKERGLDLSMRVGVHTGSVLCGLIGLHKWQFDVWSNDVTIASAMEAGGIPGATLDALKETYNVEPANGKYRNSLLEKYDMETFFVISRNSRVASSLPSDQEDETLSILDDLPSSASSEYSMAAMGSACTLKENGAKSSFVSTLKQRSSIINVISKGKTAIDRASKDKNKKRRPRRVSTEAREAVASLFSSEKYEDRLFGATDIYSTLGIKKKGQGESKPIAPSTEDEEYYLTMLKETITDSSANELWKKHANRLTLKFKNDDLESKFVRRRFQDLSYFFIPLLCLQCIFYLIQLLILPRSRVSTHICFIFSILVLLFFTLITRSHKVLPDPRLYVINTALQRHRSARYAVVLLVWLMAFLCSCIGLFECSPDEPFLKVFDSIDPQHPRCDYAFYHEVQLDVYIVFIFIPLTDLPIIGQVIAAVYGLTVAYGIVPCHFHDVFLLFFQRVTLEDIGQAAIDRQQSQVFRLFVSTVCTILGILIAWQTNYARRINFLQKEEVLKKREQRKTIQLYNTSLLRNLLPAHVIKHFLSMDSVDLYSNYHPEAGVLFASIPDFADYYEEGDSSHQGIECMRLLNEIFADFDELLTEARFKCIEKIKTIGSTYMVASGVNLTEGNVVHNWKHLEVLLEFSFALREKLKAINKHAWNDFQLRVGINHGPVVSGVIGAKKPQFDIWGDTVNVASRMESTGVKGKTQVVQETQSLLSTRGYQFNYRGVVSVKGKGSLITYFVKNRKSRGLLKSVLS